MTIKKELKNKINALIYELAFEIETKLSENDFFHAKTMGIDPSQVPDVSLKVAIKEFKKNNIS